MKTQSPAAWSDTAAHKSGFVTANGIRLHYLDWGGLGPVLILIHGGLDNAHIFDDLAPAFTDHFRVIAYDLRGHGRSDAKEPFDTTTRTEDLRGLMDSLGIAKAHLAGWSFGGNDVTAMAGTHPERVDSIVYLEGAYDWSSPAIADAFKSLPIDFRAPASAMRSLDAYRGHQKTVWFPAVSDTSRFEAYVRDLVVIQSDGTVRPRMTNSVTQAVLSTTLTDRRDYTKVHSPALAVYAETFFDVGNGDPAQLAENLEWEQKYMAPFRAASIERVRRELPNVEIVKVPGTHKDFVFTSREQVVCAMQRFLGGTEKVFEGVRKMASTTEFVRDVPVSGQSGAKAPALYRGFDGQYIDGSWRPGKHGGVEVDTDPYSGVTIAEMVMANQDDLDEAYHAAAKAQVSWAARLPAERAAVLLRSASIMEARHGEMVDWLIHESGSTRVKAELEWQFVHAVTLEAASFPHRVEGRILPLDEASKESRAYRQPPGVIGVISPWNFPMYLSHRSIGPALALGNAVVVKPSKDTPVTGGLLIAKIYEEAGLPPGLLNVVIGPSSDIGDPFTTHPIPRLISFTGSTPVGRHIGALAMQAPQIKRVALELGGNAPLVVLDDADLEHAVRSAVVGRFLHQGQVCMSTNRIIVDGSIYDEFVDRFVAHVKTLKYGDPSDPSVSIGPVINEKQLRGHLARIAGARKAGARELLGGFPDRQVLPPHVFAGVTNDMAIAQDEIFGPIAPIIKVKDEEEALHVANQTEFGLSSAVFTRDRERGVRFALRVEAGMTHVNDHGVDDAPTGPFGGEKNSGLGRFGGEWILHEFTRDHWVTVRHSNGPYPF